MVVSRKIYDDITCATLQNIYKETVMGKIGIKSFTSQLCENAGQTGFDIVAYKHFNSHREALHYFVAEKEPSWDWIRQEPKKMTLKQIEDILGYQVKIVKED